MRAEAQGALRLESARGPALLPLAGVRELAAGAELTPLPGAAWPVLGLATVRGEVLTVLAAAAAPAEPAPALRCLAVVEVLGVRFALGLESVPRAVAASAASAAGDLAAGTAADALADLPRVDLEALAASVFDLEALEDGGAPSPAGEPRREDWNPPGGAMSGAESPTGEAR